jgi:hypothetical protein
VTIPCKHWRDCGKPHGGDCAIGAYRGPSFGVCLKACEQYDGPARGVGDLVHSAIHTVSRGKIKPCGGCKKRRNNWNRRAVEKKLAEMANG